MMKYSKTETEKLRLMLARDERAFWLIWESEDGHIITGLTGKIKATDGLARRIKTVRRVLEVRKNVQRLCRG